MDFMTSQLLTPKKFGTEFRVSRCGYTGEDGFELSIPEQSVLTFIERLTMIKDSKNDQVAKFIGLGARDTLRLEAGLCLYGHDIDETTSPIEGVLGWTISKRRKEQGGFLGYKTVKQHLEEGTTRKRTGFIVEGPPAREGVDILAKDGKQVGRITSGTHGPTIKKSIGMGYIDIPYNKLNTELVVNLRGKNYPLKVSKMPFVPHRYYKK